MAFEVPGEIGDLYDIGIEVRAGQAALPCRNREGHTVNISRLGFVTSTKNQQEESTELQEKSKLVQLQGATIDREFDQWVQTTQGDWSGGQLQRIYTDLTRYWDGQGILWRTDDWVPQSPLTPPPLSAVGGPGTMNPVTGGSAAGFLPELGNCYAFFYQYTPALGTTHNHLNIQYSAGVIDVVDPIPISQQIYDFCIGGGSLWFIGQDGVTGLTLFRYDHHFGVTSFAPLVAVGNGINGMAVGILGNSIYVAAPYRVAFVGNFAQDAVRLYNVGSPTGYTNASFVDLPLPYGLQFTQAVFSGDNLIVSVTDGTSTSILQYTVATQQWGTLAKLDGIGRVYMAAAGGGLFLLGENMLIDIASNAGTVELFLLQGSSLQSIGPLDAFDGTLRYAFAQSVSRPSVYGSYVVWTMEAVNTTEINLVTFAYDVLRGRLFRVTANLNLGTNGFGAQGAPVAVFSAMGRSSPAGLNAEWGIALNITGLGVNLSNIQELLIGPQPTNQTDLVQQGVVVTSSLIDMTSSQNKLWRQALVDFTAIANDPSATVKLDIWLDQDPEALAAVPDFTGTLAGNVSPGATQLAVSINEMARKLVYRVTVTGGGFVGGTWIPAPKLIDVKVQVATGWVWHLFLLLARQALANSGQAEDYVWTRNNINGLDEVAAYNYLRQIWRLRGGACTVTLANGDSYDALIQMEKGTSPKMFARSDLSNVSDDRYEQVVEVTIREDT